MKRTEFISFSFVIIIIVVVETNGLFLILVAGLHIGWGIWRTLFIGLWFVNSSYSIIILTIMIWPLGAIFGGFIGAALTTVLKKHIIYFVSAMAMVTGNLIFIAADHEYVAIIIGRLLVSLAHGIVFVAIITQAGENAANNMRATILSTINCMLYTSIFISTIIIGTVPFTWLGFPEHISIERLIGILGLIFALLSIVCTFTVTVETVPFLLRQNQSDKAISNLRHLRNVPNESPQITQEMDEFTSMIMQDKQDNRNIFTNGNGKPLLLMIIARFMVALTNNFLLNSVLIDLTAFIFIFAPHQIRYASLVIVAPRFAMSVVQIFYADFFRRKIQVIVSSILAGIALLALGITINAINFTFSDYFIPAIFCIIFQLFCSIGVDQMPDVYFSEAFSTAKKPWSISFVAAIEHMFHIFMIGMTFVIRDMAGVSALVFVTGIVVILFGLLLTFALPETRRTTLKQARDLFRNERFFTPMNIRKGSRYA